MALYRGSPLRYNTAYWLILQPGPEGDTPPAGQERWGREMLLNFLIVAGQVVTLFLLMGVGFVLARLGKLNRDGVSQMSTLILYVVSPCVIFHSFENGGAAAGGRALLAFGAAYTVCTLILAAGSLLCFRRQPPDRRAPLRFGLIYGNNGYMGLPLLEATLGPTAVVYGAVSGLMFNLLMWTQGVGTLGGRVTLRKAVVNPAAIGFYASLPVLLFGVRPPEMVDSTIGYLASLNTPLAMIVIGAQMAWADLRAGLRDWRFYGAAAYRLLLSPLVAVLLLTGLLPLGLDPMLYCACVIVCAVPTAGVTGIMAQRFGKDTAAAAQLVSMTTLLSMLTLPVFTVLARTVSGLSV